MDVIKAENVYFNIWRALLKANVLLQRSIANPELSEYFSSVLQQQCMMFKYM